MSKAHAGPSEEAEACLRRFASYRRLGFDELGAQALVRADVGYAEVVALIHKGCPLKLVVQILS